MILTDFNIHFFALEGGFDELLIEPFEPEDTKALKASFLSDSNKNHTLLKVTIKEQVFVVKQIKYSLGGMYWSIVFEGAFYSAFKDSSLILRSAFKTNHKALILPFIPNLTSIGNICPKDLGTDLAAITSKFHEEQSFKKKIVEDFYKNHVIEKASYYHLIADFKNALKSPTFFLDSWFSDSVFSSEAASFLNQTDIIKVFLNSFSNLNETEGLIHGDLDIRNLLYDSSKERYYLIDFEYVAKGDRAWDVAVLIESVLSNSFYTDFGNSKIGEVRGLFFNSFILGYCKNYKEKETEVFLKKVLKFWALKAMDSMKNVISTDYLNYHRLIIENALLKTDDFASYILSGKKHEGSKWWRIRR